MYDGLKLLSNKTLYQLQAERLLKAENVIEKKKNAKANIPWYIMTSDATRKETADYMKDNKYFGLDSNNVTIFEQATLPAIEKDGKIILKEKHQLFRAPNGNGGLYTALAQHGILKDMKERKIEIVIQYCVDNVLVNMIDPTFIGYVHANQADCAAKTCLKKSPDESVGVMGLMNNRPSVIECKPSISLLFYIIRLSFDCFFEI